MKVRFYGRGRGPAWNQQLLAAVGVIVAERRQHLNLSKLDSVMVSFKLDEALCSFEKRQKSVSFHGKRASLQNRTATAGCAFGLMRRKRFLGHVILDAAFLTDLVDAPETEGIAANIVAHELAHVALFHWLTKPAWSYIFPTQLADWRYEAVRYVTLGFWDEYGACRLSARIGDPKAVLFNFMGCLRSHTIGGLPKLRLSTRKNWCSMAALKPFLCAVAAVQAPLRSAAYLMGHIDGLGLSVDVAYLCTAARLSPLSPCWMSLHHALRDVWDRQDPDFGFQALDGLTPALLEAIRICGGQRMIAGI